MWRISVPVDNYEINGDDKDGEIVIDDVLFHLRGKEVVGTVKVDGTREEAIKKAKQLIGQAVNKLCYSTDLKVSMSTNASYSMDLANESPLERVSTQVTFKWNIRSKTNDDSIKNTLSKINLLDPAKSDILIRALGSYKIALITDNPFKAIETYFGCIQSIIREKKKHLSTDELKKGIKSILSKRIKGFNESQFGKKFDRYYGKRSGSTHGRLDITDHEKKSVAGSDAEEVKSWAREILDDYIDRNQRNQT